MGKDWRQDLAKCFEDIRILESSQKEAKENFGSFCEFIAVPAFESLKAELEEFKVGAKILRVKGLSITLQLSFIKSSICQFQYSIFLPKNSVQLGLMSRTGGRRNKKALLEERQSPFMGGVAPARVMELTQEGLIGDVIDHYQNFLYTSITQPE
jgi:hypothetical protein